jgi:hypothetical protein
MRKGMRKNGMNKKKKSPVAKKTGMRGGGMVPKKMGMRGGGMVKKPRGMRGGGMVKKSK